MKPISTLFSLKCFPSREVLGSEESAVAVLSRHLWPIVPSHTISDQCTFPMRDGWFTKRETWFTVSYQRTHVHHHHRLRPIASCPSNVFEPGKGERKKIIKQNILQMKKCFQRYQHSVDFPLLKISQGNIQFVTKLKWFKTQVVQTTHFNT